jgi:hypothetical protein
MEKTIADFAKTFEPTSSTKNIADLKEVSVNMVLVERTGTDKSGVAYKYNVIIVDGIDYRIPGVVIGSLKAILEKKPNLKTFSVVRQGKDKENTKYTVIPGD